MVEHNIRKPAVAGRFYPSDSNQLSSMIKEISLKEKPGAQLVNINKPIYGAVVPHAGYMFSAYQAIHFFDILSNLDDKIDTFVIINPNHTGLGEKISLDSHQYWNTPFGDIEQDMEFIQNLDFHFSNSAHQEEHSGEVMLPLLQYFVKYSFKIVMITMLQQNFENAKQIALKLKNTSEKLGRKIMIIASSDFTHFKDAETGKQMDNLVLEQIENQNAEKLNRIVKEKNISVCGYGPIMCLMEYSSLFGAYASKIIAQGHSGMVIASDKVVDYISILFYKA